MIIFAAGRRMGKTTAVVSWLLEDPQHREVLVASQDRKRHLLQMIGRAIGYSMPRSFWENKILVASDWDRVRQHIRYGGASAVAIDDAEHVLASIMGAPVEFMAASATVIRATMPEKEYVDGDIVEEEDGWERAELERCKQITYQDGPKTHQRRPPRSIGS